jgi:hypothetical protein
MACSKVANLYVVIYQYHFVEMLICEIKFFCEIVILLSLHIQRAAKVPVSILNHVHSRTHFDHLHFWMCQSVIDVYSHSHQNDMVTELGPPAY